MVADSIVARGTNKNSCLTRVAAGTQKNSGLAFTSCLVSLAFSIVLIHLQCFAEETVSKRAESDYYRIVTISTSQALSDSRSKNW